MSSCPDSHHPPGSDDSSTLFCSPATLGKERAHALLHFTYVLAPFFLRLVSEPSAQPFKLEVKGAITRDVFLLSLTRGKGRPCRVCFQNSQGPCFPLRPLPGLWLRTLSRFPTSLTVLLAASSPLTHPLHSDQASFQSPGPHSALNMPCLPVTWRLKFKLTGVQGDPQLGSSVPLASSAQHSSPATPCTRRHSG